MVLLLLPGRLDEDRRTVADWQRLIWWREADARGLDAARTAFLAWLVGRGDFDLDRFSDGEMQRVA